MKDLKTDRLRMTLPSRDQAEAVAVSILNWMIADPDMMGRFLALSGLEASSIRAASMEPGFHAGLTGFVMAHEPTLMAFCEENDIKAERVAACHVKLAGPESESWT